ncbi:hypothetical protein MAR_001778 [Mya arenaria]|uniref:THAP-type domain-containing protein n=1 Tax=Mya arenaria TaxID=6604 RepID=A0ABY7FCM6_MYAAR|nr:hypothetical protein MAR_001778 [Mya arenaria]
MPKICSYGGCTCNHIQKENISFFKFPDSVKEAERRAKWARACGRQNSDGSKWKPMAKYVYICSQHFINVKGQKRMDRFNSAKRQILNNNDRPV